MTTPSAQLIADLFDAACDDQGWTGFAAIVAGALGLDQAAVVVGRGTASMDVSVTGNLVEIARTYDRHYQTLDPWAERRRHFDADRIALANELVPESILVRTEFYNDYARKIGMFRPVTADVLLENGLRLEIGADKPFAHKLMDEDDKQNLAALVPYISRAVLLRHRLRHARRDAAIGLSAMHAWPFAVIVCDARCRVVFANAAAEQMDAAGAIVLSGPGDGLLSPLPQESAMVAAHVADVAAGGPGGHLSLRGHPPARLLVSVSPLPRHLDLPRDLSLIVVRSVRERAFGPKELRVFFGLSQAQAELAIALYDGATIEEFAARRGVKLSTLRTHIAQIFLRTGTGSQKDLIRLMGQIPPLRHDR